MFKYSTCISRCTINVVHMIKKLGYKIKGPNVLDYYLICNRDGTFEFDGVLPKNDLSNIIDCGTNINRFLSIAALRDDSNYMQWFKSINGEIFKYRGDTIRSVVSTDKKLSISELMNIFKFNSFGYLPLNLVSKISYEGRFLDVYIVGGKFEYYIPHNDSPIIAEPGEIVIHLDYCDYEKIPKFYPAPKLDEVICWLEESFGVSLNTFIDPYEDRINYNIQVLTRDLDGNYIDNKCTGLFGDNGEFLSREDALEFGIEKAIELCL